MKPGSISTKTRLVRCPGCGGSSVYSEQNLWRPFCSERCRQIDLGAWASESFRVDADETEGHVLPQPENSDPD